MSIWCVFIWCVYYYLVCVCLVRVYYYLACVCLVCVYYYLVCVYLVCVYLLLFGVCLSHHPVPSPSATSLPQPRISVPARPPSINQSVSRYLCGENPKYSSKRSHVKINSTITILPQHILIHAHKLTYSYKLTILIQTNSYTYQLQLGVNKSNQIRLPELFGFFQR